MRRQLSMVTALWLLLVIAVVDCRMPALHNTPHETERSQMGLNPILQYTPQYISVDDCRYLNETLCQQRDERHRHRRNLNARTGTNIRVLVLLIKFKNHATMEVPPVEYYDELFNGDGESEINPHGSIKEWLRYNSLGKYRVSFDVRDWVVADHDESYYAGGNSGAGPQLDTISYSALTKLDNEGSIDFLNGYVDAEGNLYHLVVLHSGIIAEVGQRDCVDPPKPQDRIWSAGSGGGGPDSWTSKDYFMVSGWMITSAWDLPKCEGDQLIKQPMKMNIVCHEFCHGFDLRDLYDGSGQIRNIGGIGRFGIMASVTGWDFKRETPGYLSAFTRTTVGWVDPIVIERDGVYAIGPAELSSHIYKIDHNFPEGEYLLIESKQPIKWDSDIPNPSGLVIYHVDENVHKNIYPYYPGTPQWPAEHYKVAVLQADRRFEIEQGANSGDKNDFWRKGSILAADGDYPNTNAYSTGTLVSTGITIEVLTNSRLIMLFRVTGIGTRSGSIPIQADDSLRGSRDTTGATLQWVLSMFGGLALMLGLLVLVL